MITATKLFVFLLLFLSSQSEYVLEGSKTSYLQFRRWPGGLDTGLEFQFRTGQQDTLILYTDDIINCIFLELKLVKGAVQLRYDFGLGPGVLRTTVQQYGDNTWHKVALDRGGLKSTLTVDSEIISQSINSSILQSVEFSNTNMYIGGIPTWLAANSNDLSVPSVVFEPTLQGGFKDLVYKGRSGDSKQKLVAYKGIRASTLDACTYTTLCQNNGRCIATDQGPTCDCEGTNFTGIYCETKLEVPETFFNGRNGIIFQLRKGLPILSLEDKISFHFKTQKSSGILFYAGHATDFVLIFLKEGKIGLTIHLNSGQLDTAIKPIGEFFNDNHWHEVVLTRKTSQMADGQTMCHVTLLVDEKYSETWRSVGHQKYILTTKILFGGSDEENQEKVLEPIYNLIGCMKMVYYEAGSIKLNLISLAKNNQQSVIKLGHIDFKCQDLRTSVPLPYVDFINQDKMSMEEDNSDHSQVISLSAKNSYLVLPPWRFNSTGSISLKIRTIDPSGLILFNSGINEQKKDFFAVELINGNIFLHLNLGVDTIKIQASQSDKQIADGKWHKIEISIMKHQGRITIDDETEVFTKPGDSEEVFLNGPFYLGGLDYLENKNSFPTSVWSTSLQDGYTGCIKELFVNGAVVDLGDLAHQQNSGSIRLSCHSMPGQCYDRPCQNGGICKESWNRYECDCDSTSFTGPTCSRGASTIQFNGKNYLEINLEEELLTEVHQISIRFRSTEDSGLLFFASSGVQQDIIEVSLQVGKVKVNFRIGLFDKTFYIGQSLNDDLWHTIRLSRKGSIIEGSVDDDDSVKSELYGSGQVMSLRSYFIGGQSDISKSSIGRNFVGRIQQLVINTEHLIEESHLQQIQYHGKVKFQHVEDVIYNSISFLSHHTYLGMPQLKVYNNVDIFFKFKTSEENGLLMYNAGKNNDFLGLELVNGHVHYIFNMGYGPVTLKDNTDSSLADNKYHSVWVRRPTRYSQVLIIDNYHKVSSSGLGDNYYLNLDGILHLGGVKSEMYSNLPFPLTSKTGFQGCMSNLEVNGEAIDPNKDALVPSPQVIKGCQDSFAYEFLGKTYGLITYKYPEDKQPDTKSDTLTVGFITGVGSCVLVRIDSAQSNDFIELRLEKGFVVVEYNLGTESIIIAEKATTFNDGEYHVARFVRVGPNATLQMDNHKEITKTPDGRHLTVFNSQYLVQIGGRFLEAKQIVEHPFQGVLAGLIYNGNHLLEMAFQKRDGVKLRGSVIYLPSIPSDYKGKVEELTKLKSESLGQIHTTDNTESWTNCDDDDLCEGSGSSNSGTKKRAENTGLGRGVYFAGGGFMPCDDDEDICDFGSGDSDSSIFTPSEHDIPELVTMSSPTSISSLSSPQTTLQTVTEDTIWIKPEDTNEKDIWNVMSIDETTQPSEKCYDEKHNVQCDEVTQSPTEAPKKDIRGMSGTMSLVIGIILGSFIAMILIVIIVLKVRTGVDITELKQVTAQEEMKRYQFSSPSGTEREDYPSDTGTKSLLNGTKHNNNNSLFNGSLSNALTGDRAKLFKKANSYGKPVREWYV